MPGNFIMPIDLIREVSSPSPNGSLGNLGIVNPPSLTPFLQKLGIENNPTVRILTDNLQAPTPKKIPAPSTEAGSFVNPARRPFALTCQQWIEDTSDEAIKWIYCRVNPRSVQWTMNLRVADQKTLAGVVQHAWRQNLGVRRRTYFSEPTVAITFQSGNIMPVYPERFKNSRAPHKEYQMPRGLENFYRFVDLLSASRVVVGPNSDSKANVIYITYTSQVYPSIVLAGMFTPEGFTFTDNAEDPNKIEWTANFTIYDSFPRFDNAQQLINSWKLIQAPSSGTAVGEGDADQTSQEDVQVRTEQQQAEGRAISQEREARNET